MNWLPCFCFVSSKIYTFSQNSGQKRLLKLKSDHVITFQTLAQAAHIIQNTSPSSVQKPLCSLPTPHYILDLIYCFSIPVLFWPTTIPSFLFVKCVRFTFILMSLYRFFPLLRWLSSQISHELTPSDLLQVLTRVTLTIVIKDCIPFF